MTQINPKITQLVETIRETPIVKKQAKLKAKKWPYSAYELLANLINDHLQTNLTAEEKYKVGTYISGKTIQNLFNGITKINDPIDPRLINTLDKICIFCKFNNWDNFNEELANQNNEDITIKVVKNAVSASFSYLKEDEAKVELLEPFFIEKSQAENYIKDIRQIRVNENSLTLSNEFNPSIFQLLNIEQYKLISEIEHWIKVDLYQLFCWYSKEKKAYSLREKIHSNLIYKCICGNENTWKVDCILPMEENVNNEFEDNVTHLKVGEKVGAKKQSKRLTKISI
jgi:hypothetical protein